MADYLDDIHQDIAEFAERHIEDEEERAGFVDQLMERKGYQRQSHWAPPQQDGGGQPPKGLLRPGGTKKPAGQGGQRSYFKQK